MRIGIDIRSLQNNSQYRGIGTYTRCLIKSTLEIDKDNEYVFFAFRNRPIPEFFKEKPFRTVEIKRVDYARKRLVWTLGQIYIPFVSLKERLDIYHSPEYMVPIFATCKKVITVHDFIYRDYEIYKKIGNCLERIHFYLREQTLKCADEIIADSYYTKKKIVELIGITEDKIQVIHLAPDKTFRLLNDAELSLNLQKRYNLYRDFLLYVGVIDPHKNIDSLIRAFSQIRFKEIDLVLVGVKNIIRYFAFINRLIEKLGLKNRVHILGYIPQEDLVGLYNMAKIVVLVSFYEGFGLPVLEAMSCGRPVIASNNTSMGEIVGSCGILVDPYNTEEITQAINNLLSNEELRNLLSKRGLEHSKEFSWEKAAEKTVSLYKEILR